MKKKITILTPCFNEEENVLPLIEKVKEEMAKIDSVEYVHLFIDNASTDQTLEQLKTASSTDSSIQVIANARNFGHLRSPFYGLMQAQGDAVILLVADFQDPIEMLPMFIEKWQQGNKVVIGKKNDSDESPLMFAIRKFYYYLVNTLSEIPLAKNFTGFGLYDRSILEELRKMNDPYPYFRGMIFEVTNDITEIPYTQPTRARGITKNNFYTLYDLAMLGICSHSKVPLRITTLVGFFLAGLSLLISVGYGLAKIILWDTFSMGMAPVVMGLFFFSSVQLIFLGVIGEYIGLIYTKVASRPQVHEKLRINC